jgi:Flp pilus assembly protein TadB
VKVALHVFSLRFSFGITAALDALAVAVVMIIAFVAFVAVHTGARHLGAWLVRRRKYAEVTRFGEELRLVQQN